MADWDISRFSSRPGLMLRYGVAVISVAIALAITIITHLHNSTPRFVSHFVLIAIAITFWFAGTGPGVLALLLSCLGVTLLSANHFLTPDFPLAQFLGFFVVFAFLMTLFSVSRRRAQTLLREARDAMVGLEARVNERTRIARDLHDTLLQRLHGLMFEFQAARNLFQKRPQEALLTLDDAILGTERAIGESQEAIEGLRGDAVTDNDIAQRLRAIGKELVADRGVDQDSPTFGLTVEGERRNLVPIIREEVYRIACEVVRNAFRHAKARRIEAEILYGDQQFRLRVRDDGQGIDPHVLEKGGRAGHWGLPGVRERAQQMGAKLDFWSEVGAGTEVQLVLPGSVAYGKTHNHSRFRLFRGTQNHEHRA